MTGGGQRCPRPGAHTSDIFAPLLESVGLGPGMPRKVGAVPWRAMGKGVRDLQLLELSTLLPQTCLPLLSQHSPVLTFKTFSLVSSVACVITGRLTPHMC